MSEGYFDEHEIFLRAPDVYQAHLGPYRPPRPDTSQPAALATWFLEQQDAAAAQQRQRQTHVPEEEEEEEGEAPHSHLSKTWDTAGGREEQGAGLSLSERRPVPAELLDAMQQRFLCGQV